MKKVLVIYGHSRKESFVHSLGQSYADASKSKGNEIKEVYLVDLPLGQYLNFPHQPVNDREKAYPAEIQALHSDLLWADHIVFAFPTWWGLPPAIVKLYVDMAFAPKVAFRYLPMKNGIVRIEKLLKGKTARLLVTMDSPTWYYKYITKNAIGNSFKTNILGFCGVKTLGVNYFGSVKASNEATRVKWLTKASQLGQRD